MSDSNLPARPSLEFLKKLAKDRLRLLRQRDPAAKLADSLLAVARDHGFASWRALKAEVERRQSQPVADAFAACARGEADRLRELLAANPALERAEAPASPHGGWTLLHDAAKHGHESIVRLLLEHGADPNAREAGDNTCPLHWAAARGDLETMRALLDAGGDVHGLGADHAGDVIGWATFFTEPGKDVAAVAAFLTARGARHHAFSAIAVGDLDLIRAVVEENPEVLDSHLSRFEHGLTPLQFAIVKKRDDIVDLLIELGADLEAEDMHGQTALTGALSIGNHSAARRLRAAGARPPRTIAASEFKEGVTKLSGSIAKIVPMLNVPDVAAALAWYVSIGFTESGRYADGGVVNWGMVKYGGAEIMLNMHGKAGAQPVSLWLYTDQVEQLYKLFKARQLEAAQAGLDGNAATDPPIQIVEEIYNPPYGGREFGIRDLNGFELFFLQPA
jgi:ankyrin repeat protein